MEGQSTRLRSIETVSDAVTRPYKYFLVAVRSVSYWHSMVLVEFGNVGSKNGRPIDF